MNDTKKLNWLLKKSACTRTDLDNAMETDKLIKDIVADMRGDRPALPSFKERFYWLLSYHNKTIGEKGLIRLSVDIIDAEILSDNGENDAAEDQYS
jgi:hypothetical protein